ncbi:hypothetical protein HY256_00980 [Candidatus Sumerlaeota bacterium]|nr:hypothetical protein [Candidatus Sumerlaeota bacterium]
MFAARGRQAAVITQYSQFDPETLKKMNMEQIMKLFLQLLGHTGGKVEQREASGESGRMLLRKYSAVCGRTSLEIIGFRRRGSGETCFPKRAISSLAILSAT